MENATSIFRIFWLYNGNTWFFPLFLAAVAFLLWKLDAQNRRNAILTAAAAVLMAFNEAVFWLAGKVDDVQTYYRFLWMIPVIPTLAYVCVDVVALQKTAARRGLAAAFAVLLAVLAGDCYLETSDFTAQGAASYLDSEAVDICNMISADKTEERPIVACDYPLVLSMRLYDATIKNAITRSTYRADGEVRSAYQRRLYKLVSGQEVVAKKIKRTLAKNKVSYVVIKTAYERDALMQKIGCSILGRTSSCTVYRVG